MSLPLGHIDVSCISCISGRISTNKEVLIRFLSIRGDVPNIIVSDSGTEVNEVVKGKSQPVIGRSIYSKEIQGLTSEKDWNVEVYAYNSIASSSKTIAWPSPLRLTAVPTSVPLNVDLEVSSATSLVVTWNSASSDGGC